MKSLETEKRKILQLRNVCKRFGGVTAADDISLELYGGEIFGLIGPNGSGKTTLLNLITGIYSSDSGEIILDGRNITKLPTYKRACLGIARTFQHPRLLGRCDIRKNIQLGSDLSAKRKLPLGKEYQARLARLLKAAGLDAVDLNDSIEKLSYGQQKMLEIVRSILTSPRVLLLDEPAAGLNHAEMEYIVALMGIAVEEGVAVLLIEHAMDLVMSVCDRLTVLNFGHQITTGTPGEVQNNEDVISAYLGGGSNAEN